jgi:hypothetical protein
MDKATSKQLRTVVVVQRRYYIMDWGAFPILRLHHTTADLNALNKFKWLFDSGN